MRRRPPELAQVVALGLIQGACELLPVSSSAHVAAIPRLLGWDVASWDAARRKELEVALHAGAALALAPEFIRLLPGPRTLALSLAPPVVIGGLFERAIEERLDGLVAGLLLGAAALALADRAPQRDDTGEPGLWLGIAQAAALLPGVSRSGATLAAARALGYPRAEASRLSFGVAGPVLVGATALKAWRGHRTADQKLIATGIAASFVGTRAGLRAFGLERGPLWPFAAERALLAGAILGVRYGRRP
jgi:undecaprenyl-diphosphatase